MVVQRVKSAWFVNSGASVLINSTHLKAGGKGAGLETGGPLGIAGLTSEQVSDLIRVSVLK